MDPFVRGFIRSSLVWLSVGVGMGVWIAVWPQAIIYRPAHVHANMLGFTSMMIFGVAYHILPRFVGAPLFNPRLGPIHLVLGNLGLLGMVTGWIARPHVSWWAMSLRVGATLSAMGVVLFVINIWRTLDKDTTTSIHNIAIRRK